MRFGNYSTFSFIDVETTGTSASGDRVLEVGIIRVENGKIVGEMNTLIDPDVYIPPEITMITGITGDDIAHAPHFSDVADEVSELLKDSVFVAHNARFDYAFIRHEFRRLGLPFSPKTLCTVKLSRRLYPSLPRHNLDSIISFLGVNVERRHRAYDDAYVLYELMRRVEREFPNEDVTEILNNFLKSPSLPTHIDKSQIEALPEGPGVYLMYGADETLLYVGKSVDIRARVLSHFYNDFDSSTDLKLSKEVRRIDTIATAGDFGASMREASLIKSMLPIYNRALRRDKGLLAAVEIEENGYLSVEERELSSLALDQIPNVLFVASSRKQFQEILRSLAKENKLCLRILGLERGKGRCFGSQIGLCNGACIEEEPPFKHNVRFKEAFHHKRVKSWPFPGAVGIREQFEDREEVHVINNWCYLGSFITEGIEADGVKKNIMPPVFSWDNYKILSRFIKKYAASKMLLHNLDSFGGGEIDNYYSSYPNHS